MTTTVSLNINKHCDHEVSVRLIAHDGRVLRTHSCAAGNVAEHCEFTIYDGVQLEIREGDFPASNALAEIIEARQRISELEHELAALKVPVELNDGPAPKGKRK